MSPRKHRTCRPGEGCGGRGLTSDLEDWETMTDCARRGVELSPTDSLAELEVYALRGGGR